MRLRSNQIPPHGSENLSQTRIYLIRALANLVNLDCYYQMTFNECMDFILKASRGTVNPHSARVELLLLFENRGFDIRLTVDGE